MKKVGVAILGLGVVGSGAYEILTTHREFFRKTQNVDIVVENVLEVDGEKVRALGVPSEIVAMQIAEVVSNPDVNIVAECIGGVTEAREYVLAALNAGKTVVTANKELVCKYSHELERAAKRQNAGLYFEASCVGGVPIVRTLLDGVQSNEVLAIHGVINGTTNYILSRMEEGVSYEDALQEAKELGYTEADASADVDGYDAAYKLSILASLAFHTKVPLAKITREGIGGISPEDVREGRTLGYALKLLAIGKQTSAGIEARVHPTFIPVSHPLASVNGSFNAVHLTCDGAGDVMLYGRGAGKYPTGSAVVSDIIYASTHGEVKYSTFKNNASADREVTFVSDFRSAYYLRLTVTDKAGALAKISAILCKYAISISALRQESQGEKASVVLVTHETHEAAVRNAVSKINASGLAQTECVLRVLS